MKKSDHSRLQSGKVGTYSLLFVSNFAPLQAGVFVFKSSFRPYLGGSFPNTVEQGQQNAAILENDPHDRPVITAFCRFFHFQIHFQSPASVLSVSAVNPNSFSQHFRTLYCASSHNNFLRKIAVTSSGSTRNSKIHGSAP